MATHCTNTGRFPSLVARVLPMRKNARFAIAAMGLVVACANVHAEPLSELNVLVAHCTEAFQQSPMTEVAYAEAAQSWVKRVYAPPSVTYRVRKTSSTVSPYVAQIEIVQVASARRGDDEDTARALDVSMDENLMRSVRRINFAYQGDTWTVMGGTVVAEVKRDAADEFSRATTARLSREAVLEATGPVAACARVSPY